MLRLSSNGTGLCGVGFIPHPRSLSAAHLCMFAGLGLILAFIVLVAIFQRLGMWETSGALRAALGLALAIGNISVVFESLRRVAKERP